MGSPTSPALSNFATRDLDIEFLQWGRRNNIRYTRFVDDCTFSSQSELEELHISQAENIFKSHGFMVNPDKTRLYEKEDIKTVTGLELHNRPEIPDAFFTRLDDDILRLKHVIEVHTINFGTTLPDWIQQFEKSLRGKVNFTGMVYGLKSDLYNKYSAMLEDALLVNEEQLFAGWRDFDNYSF